MKQSRATLAIVAMTLAAILMIVVFATTADAASCTDYTIDHTYGVPQITDTSTYEYQGYRVDLVGHYLWVQYEGEETSSFDMADQLVTGVTVCPDGTVTVHAEQPDLEPVEVAKVEADEPVSVTYRPDSSWWDLIE